MNIAVKLLPMYLQQFHYVCDEVKNLTFSNNSWENLSATQQPSDRCTLYTQFENPYTRGHKQDNQAQQFNILYNARQLGLAVLT